MQPEHTWNLLARKLNGEATREERMELGRLIQRKPEIALYLQALTNLWHQHSQKNRKQITAAFRRMIKNDFPVATSNSQHKQVNKDASFYVPGKNSIAINYSPTGWEDFRGCMFYEDVAEN